MLEPLFYALHGTATALHMYGFYLLYITRYMTNFKMVQRFYLLHLSFSEASISVLSLIRTILSPRLSEKHVFMFHVVQYGTLNVLFYVTYIILTIDRFMVAYLNICYNLIMTLTKIRRCFYVIYLWMILCGVLLMLFHPMNIKKLYKHIVIFMWIPGDISFSMIATLTYSYIALKKRKMLDCRLPTHKHSKSAVYLPSLLIISFVVFYIIPDLINAGLFLTHVEIPLWFTLLTESLISFGYVADAILYTFSCRTIRIKRSVSSLKVPINRHSILSMML